MLQTLARRGALALLLALSLFHISPAFAQSASCTTVASGTSQDITAHGVCKKVTFAGLSGAASVCAVTGTTPQEWQSFYDNPPAGVSIAACSGGCTGYSYGGYCYYYSGDASANSCDTTCASQGGCNAAGTRYIGSDEPGSTRCSAVATALSGTPITASGGTTAGYFGGCAMNTIKGGWVGSNMYTPTTTCADATFAGRICACNGGGGSAPCNLPWGGTIAHNASVTAYSSSTAACGQTCAGLSQTRTCTNGSLSGSYTNSGCSGPGACTDCTTPWGATVTNGSSGVLITPARWEDNIGCASGGWSCAQMRARGTCTNGVLTCSDTLNGTLDCSYFIYTSCAPGCSGGSCFTSDTMVTMADGSKKPIAELKAGDVVRGSTTNNTVKDVVIQNTDEPLYGINGSRAFVTGGHPFRTADGWKAIDPAQTPRGGHNVTTTTLSIGDILFLDDGGMQTLLAITKAEATATRRVYNPILDGDNTYFADGFLVHNKIRDPLCGGMPC